MKWLVIGIGILAALAFAGGKFAGAGADNTDSQALATIFYIPALILTGLDVILLAGWGIYRLLFT